MKNIEVEIRFQLLNLKRTESLLLAQSNPTTIKHYQKDTYYNAPHKDFISINPISEWLRVRESDMHSYLNYKNLHGENTVSCDEVETSVNNPKNLKKILINLGFTKIVTVEKYRTSWESDEIEISIDEVIGLGNYIELEAKGSFTNIESAKKHIYSYANSIKNQLGKQDIGGYPLRILEIEGYNLNGVKYGKNKHYK